MSDDKITLQDITRKTYFEYPRQQKLSLEEIRISLEWRNAEALEQIAKNTEIMTQDYVRLRRDYEWQKGKIERLERENEELKRSNSALRGVITRKKNGK